MIAEAPQPLSWHGPTPSALPEIQRTGLICPRAVELRRGEAKELAATTLIHDLEAEAEGERARRNGPLKGWRLFAVADSHAAGEVMDLAIESGAKAAVNVTKTVIFVIADDAPADDPRIRAAHEHDVEVVSVHNFLT
ncbi:hypothetical protein AB0I28_29705 [Phytomonospora sp. NPDC050363]|uniref:hypothetical protein n=1 Tax=Phytomonospora sp. NPDC050363 TaxID=3155642 RepID=UPI0033C24E4B